MVKCMMHSSPLGHRTQPVAVAQELQNSYGRWPPSAPSVPCCFSVSLFPSWLLPPSAETPACEGAWRKARLYTDHHKRFTALAHTDHLSTQTTCLHRPPGLIHPRSPEEQGRMMQGQLLTDKPRLPCPVSSHVHSGGGALSAHICSCHLKDQSVDLSIQL